MRSIRALVMLMVAMALPVLLPTPAQAVDGDFIRTPADGAVYRMAGGAPIYVSSWAAVGAGGVQPYTDITPEQFASLPAYPWTAP